MGNSNNMGKVTKTQYVVQKPTEYPTHVHASSPNGWDDIGYDALHDTQVAAVNRLQQYMSRPARIIKREVVETILVTEERFER